MSAESSNLSNIEHRAVIKYFVKKGKTRKKIFEDMVSVLQESAPPYTMVKKWARLFQQGRESCEDDPRPGRPVTVRQYDPGSKQESMQWTKKGERPPKKFKVQKSASKLMATIFWDSEGTRGSRTEATWEVIARSVVLQDNASVHTARVSRQALKDTGFLKLTTHPTAQI
ncbi:hypothetical protein EVAR_25788_1 [Eumeta japonica]|uniref:Mos1 transposase HTH domain-containing protein n=1 Tax=Eumeta variegata TaxID=151549 RepID=A0A4C1VTY3_EUMVA|nr:hypothetical protein EVAR_25788_1 [Eumeta japonica]